MESLLRRGRALLVALLALAVILPGAAMAQSSTLPDGIQDVRFGDHGTFERAVIDLDPGTAPQFTSSYRKGDHVVRVKLPTAGATATTDGAGLGKAISRYYVVRDPGTSGSLFVDFHLKGAAKNVKVFKLSNPGRVVVDVTPGGTARFPKPSTGDKAVVISPRKDRLVGPGSFTVKGYARPFEATGAWRIKGPNGSVVSRGNYQTNDYIEAWGSYSFSADYPAKLGGRSGTLQVGQVLPTTPARFVGTSFPLRFR